MCTEPGDAHGCNAPSGLPPHGCHPWVPGQLPTPSCSPPQPYFNKLMKRKWLTSSEAFDTIVMLITSFTQKLRPLRPEPYQVGARFEAAGIQRHHRRLLLTLVPQVLVSEVHRRVLIEYVRPLLQVRLVCTSAKMRARVAARLGDEARQLRELFSRLVRLCPSPPWHPWVLLGWG